MTSDSALNFSMDDGEVRRFDLVNMIRNRMPWILFTRWSLSQDLQGGNLPAGDFSLAIGRFSSFSFLRFQQRRGPGSRVPPSRRRRRCRLWRECADVGFIAPSPSVAVYVSD